MSYPALVAARAKWDRGVKDLDALEKRVGEIRKGDLYRLQVDFDRETGWHTVHARVKDMPPPDLSVLAGNVAYQCLSALEVSRDIAFPISAKRDDFMSLRMIKHGYISPDATAALEGVQPYKGPHGPSGPRQHPLFHIKAIVDADKHRILAAGFAQIILDGITFRWDKSIASDPIVEHLLAGSTRLIHDDTAISRIRFQSGNAQVKVDVDRQPPIDVQFANGTSLLSTDALRACAGATRWTISQLTPLFPDQPNPWGSPIPRPSTS